MAKMGCFKRILNKERRGAENKYYFEGKIQLDGDVELHILLTDNQLVEAIKRSRRNIEDIRKDGFLSDLLD